ncbi:hypothetical protein BDR26DRAFT_870123 [Obelidium mucronatum]|nr:hypothetical protein BDR26DRAFT_870123 [Obelidium mucronatum]
MRNKLHACISMIPVTQLAWIGYIVTRYISIGTKGPVNTDFTALFAIQSVLLFVKDFVLMFCLALMAKGWGVIRVRLSGVESRTIGGVAFFYALSDVLYSYDFDFMFVFWIFALTSYYYVLWTVLIHIQNAEKHVSLSQAKLDSLHTAPTPVLNQNNIVVDETSTVDEENAEINTNEINRSNDAAVAQSNSTLRVLDRVGVLTRTNLWAQVFPPRPSFPKDAFGNRIVGMGEDWKLLWTLQSKLWVIISAKNIVIYYAFFTLIDKIIQLLGVNVIPFYPTFPNLYHLGGFYWIATVFMLRQPEQIVVIPKWVLSKRQEMGQPVSVEAEGGDERLSQVLAEMRESRPRSQFVQRIRETVQRRRGRPTVE